MPPPSAAISSETTNGSQTLPSLIARMRAHDAEPDEKLLARAWDFSSERHRGQQRLSGEPYFVHLFETAALLADLGLDTVTVASGLLHDTVEDTGITADELAREFGAEIAHIVQGVSKIGSLPLANLADQQAENLRKMLLAMADDLRVVLVKVADRTHNMRTLDFLPADKRPRIARETLDVYAPLAHRLGMGGLKSELEDLSFRHLFPDEFAALTAAVVQRRTEGEPFLARARETLTRRFAESGIEAQLVTRVKHLWSLWRKVKDREKALAEIQDLFGLRVLTHSLRDCYGALGIVQTVWKPLPQRFKDYIAMPKSNLYQSLHTTVMTEGGELLEVQIRTHEMHRIAERGVAAHWQYKAEASGERVDPRSADKLAWVHEITEWQKETPSGPDFLEKFRVKLFEDEVFVFTPRGEVRPLPAGASPLDFAFEIHSDIGFRCVGAKVNGRLVPLKHPLRNGDIVEIVTAPDATPSRDWLKFVRTSKARNRIKHHFRELEIVEKRQRGREMLEREVHRRGLPQARTLSEEGLSRALRELSLPSTDALYDLLAEGEKLSSRAVVEVLSPAPAASPHASPPHAAPAAPVRPGRDPSTAPRMLEPSLAGKNVLMTFAKCCNPLPGDPIWGFVTRGRGVSLHRTDCENAAALVRRPEGTGLATVAVGWEAVPERLYDATIEVVAADRAHLLAELAGTIGRRGFPIASAQARTEGKTAVCVFSVKVKSRAEVDALRSEMQAVSGVVSVRRS